MRRALGKRVVVTSSTRGIGRGVAETFLRAGAKVFIGSRNPEAVRETLESLRKISPAVWGITVDMTSLESVGRFSREARETLGGIDVLIINSGNPSNEPATFFETTMEDWIQSVNLFLLSPIKLIREMAEDMMKGKWGRIFFLSSYTVKEPKDFFSLADVSRSPLIQLTKILGRELGPFNITVNTILMGTFDSEGARDSISKLAKRRGQPFEKIWLEEVVGPVPVGRIGDSIKDLGALLLFLTSEEGSYITGSYIVADGGITQAV